MLKSVGVTAMTICRDFGRVAVSPLPILVLFDYPLSTRIFQLVQQARDKLLYPIL